MNYLGKFAKYNWSPAVLGISFATNLGLTYYKYNIDGISKSSPIVEWCHGNSHIFSSSSYKERGGVDFIFEPMMITPILGALSVALVVHDVYENHCNNKVYKSDKKIGGCECGKF